MAVISLQPRQSLEYQQIEPSNIEFR